MAGSRTERGSSSEGAHFGRPLVDPRLGDIEDDLTSPKQRSLLAIAGGLLAEISLPKLLFAWTMLLLVPAVLLGVAPLVATAWVTSVSAHVLAWTEVGAVLVLVAIVVLGWFGWRPFLRIVEDNFWSLNALIVQPGYMLGCELLRHLTERIFAEDLTVIGPAGLRATSSAAAGIIMSGCATLLVIILWPSSRWLGAVSDLAAPHHLILPAMANAIILVSGYLAIASLVWGFADATMDQPVDLNTFDNSFPDRRTWRIAHLSDLHVVGERYGFRIESGRSGPQGNDRVYRVLARLANIHTANPIDLVLVSGDMTDAGRAAEWAEFIDAIGKFPALAERMMLVPGNHDVNIVDRTNPARLDLPFSPTKRLRQMRALSAIAAVQGDRVHVFDHDQKREQTLNQGLTPHRAKLAKFAEYGGLRLSIDVGRIYHNQFPMILAPQESDGLGVAILNSNVESHFSFTNALGFISVQQLRRLLSAIGKFPKAIWIIALHHHLLEYPMPVAFSERVGTALVNGSWFVRQLKPFAARTVVMHGHRHVDWIGTCGLLKIISAPSPVMGATDDAPTHFHIHTVVAEPGGRISLRSPERVEISGSEPSLRAGA
jgi:predicted MPP superfamily phosphohydrolase